MNDKELGKIMYEKALAFIDKRFPTGWGDAFPKEDREEYEAGILLTREEDRI